MSTQYKDLCLVPEVVLLSLGSCDECIHFGKKESTSQPSSNTESSADASFLPELIKKLIGGQVYRKRQNSNNSLPPEGRFNLSLGHFPVLLPARSHCKVHMQRVDTQYACSVCYITMCPYPSFERFHTL